MRNRPFQPLRHIERTLERVVEGPVSLLFRNRLQPATIYRSIEREMLAGSLPSRGRSIVPNEFAVSMNPEDMDSFNEIGEGLETHFEELLEEAAEESNLVFLGAVRVDLVPDEQQPPRNISVIATVSPSKTDSEESHPEPQSYDDTESFELWRQPPREARYGIVIGADGTAGITHYLFKSRNSIGRALDNDIVISSPQMSRHHAVIEVQNDVARILDLESTNGTFVNNQRIIEWSILKHGDLLVFGTQATRVIRDQGR